MEQEPVAITHLTQFVLLQYLVKTSSQGSGATSAVVQTVLGG